MDIAEFLLARIAEDERRAKGDGVGRFDAIPDDCWDPGRVLAECEAKRRIVDLADSEARSAAALDELGDQGGHLYDAANTMRDVLRLIALPYADHKDYRPEWSLEARV